jgi:hypothetical protein
MLYHEDHRNCGTVTEIIKSVHQEKTKLSDVYFSSENLNLLQNEIRKNIHNLYGYKIDRQSEDDLLIIMRGFYTLYANPETHLVRQEIIKLNKAVIDKATKMIVTNIKMYKIYLRDASNLPVPLQRSELFTSRSNDNIEFKGFF